MALQNELAGLRSAPRGVYRSIYDIDDIERLVIVYRIATARPAPADRTGTWPSDIRRTVVATTASGLPRVELESVEQERPERRPSGRVDGATPP